MQQSLAYSTVRIKLTMRPSHLGFAALESGLHGLRSALMALVHLLAHPLQRPMRQYRDKCVTPAALPG
eukprot:522518-Prorocentrum_minimum.AAC.1